MSLIAEALRKAGKVPPRGHSAPARKRSLLLYGGLAAAGTLCMILALSLIQAKPSSSKPVVAPVRAPEPAPGALPPEESPPAASESTGVQLILEAQNQWRLNGIVRGTDGEALALINDRLIEKGGAIEGARVVRISRDEVDLEKDGEISTLTLH